MYIFDPLRKNPLDILHKFMQTTFCSDKGTSREATQGFDPSNPRTQELKLLHLQDDD